MMIADDNLVQLAELWFTLNFLIFISFFCKPFENR